MKPGAEFYITMRRKDLMPIACHDTLKEATACVVASLEASVAVANSADTALFIVRVVNP